MIQAVVATPDGAKTIETKDVVGQTGPDTDVSDVASFITRAQTRLLQAKERLQQVQKNGNFWKKAFGDVVIALYGPKIQFDVPSIIGTVKGLKEELDRQRQRAIQAERALDSRNEELASMQRSLAGMHERAIAAEQELAQRDSAMANAVGAASALVTAMQTAFKSGRAAALKGLAKA